MKVNREALASALHFAMLGCSTRGETVEQSNCFVFTGGELLTFNDEILTRSKSPLPEETEAAILAADFIKLLDRMPDEELDITFTGDEVRLKGSRRAAGVTCQAEILLPLVVPKGKKFSRLGEGVMDQLQQAARICGTDATQELTMMVHATPKLIEACDNWRLFRADIKTGFKQEVLLPGSSLIKISSQDFSSVCVDEGWAHFRTKAKSVVSVRCSHEPYHDQMDSLLQLEGAEQVKLPSNLDEIIQRTVVMMDSENEPRVRVHLSANKLILESRKDSGWYRETKKIKYTGPDMEFEVNPKFLLEMLSRARSVLVLPGNRMKMESDGIQFVVALIRSQG